MVFVFLPGLDRLSEYVEHYEALHYDAEPVAVDHHRHKRSAPADDHRVRVDFVAHGRRFNMELKRDHSVFHDNLVIKDQDENTLHHLDTSHIYEGRVLGERRLNILQLTPARLLRTDVWLRQPEAAGQSLFTHRYGLLCTPLLLHSTSYWAKVLDVLLHPSAKRERPTLEELETRHFK